MGQSCEWDTVGTVTTSGTVRCELGTANMTSLNWQVSQFTAVHIENTSPGIFHDNVVRVRLVESYPIKT